MFRQIWIRIRLPPNSRDLLHAANLRHETDEGRRAEDFFALKNPTASAGFEPANLGTKGQHANPYTTEASLVSVQSHKHFISRDQSYQVFIKFLITCSEEYKKDKVMSHDELSYSQ